MQEGISKELQLKNHIKASVINQAIGMGCKSGLEFSRWTK
jgi:hypothetical protein